jgi:hypothetical protein
MAERKAGEGTPAPKAAPDGAADEAKAPAKPKVCFVATPIGAAGSETRKRANQIQRHIINPCVTSLGYAPIRADEITQPGMIPRQIIQHLLDADLVVIDLAEYNPNVYYEMAIRHMVGKPIVHLMERDKPLPFDVQQNRTIFVDVHDLDSVAECREALEAQIRALEDDPTASDNPISYAVDYTAVRGSNNPQERVLASLLAEMEQITHRLDRQPGRSPAIQSGIVSRAIRQVLQPIMQAAEVLAGLLATGRDQENLSRRETAMLVEVEDAMTAINEARVLLAALIGRQDQGIDLPRYSARADPTSSLIQNAVDARVDARPGAPAEERQRPIYPDDGGTPPRKDGA